MGTSYIIDNQFRGNYRFVRKCPYCGSKVLLHSASFIYPHREDLSESKVWVCSRYPKCDAYVGCHPHTDVPLGRLADSRLRFYKKMAHNSFDRLWRFNGGKKVRGKAYKWLAWRLGISESNCHIGMFDEYMCMRVKAVCDDYWDYLCRNRV